MKPVTSLFDFFLHVVKQQDSGLVVMRAGCLRPKAV
jgi:hypothetical protein